MLCPWRTGRLTFWWRLRDDESGTRPENSGHNSGDGDGFVRKTWIHNRYLRVPCVPYDKWYVMIFMQNLYVYAFHNSDSCLDQTGKFARQDAARKMHFFDSYCEAIWVPVAVVAAISLAVLFFFSFDTLEYQARSNDRDGGCVVEASGVGIIVVMHWFINDRLTMVNSVGLKMWSCCEPFVFF